MRLLLARLAAVVATALLLGGVVAPAGAVPPRIPMDKPIPMPEGSGYACWAFQDEKRVQCNYTDYAKRWRDAEKYDGCQQRADGWRVCITEKPNMRHPGSSCDIPQYANNPLCRWEKESGTQLDWSNGEQHMMSTLVPAWPGGMWPGTHGWLAKDDYLESKNWRYRLYFQADGNLVAYGPKSKVLWHSGTWGNPGANLVMQADGNAVIYAPDGRALWSTGTYGNPQAQLWLTDSGSLQVRRTNGSVAWATPAAK